MGNGTGLKPFEMFFYEVGHHLDHNINLKKLKGFEDYFVSEVWRSSKYKGFTLDKMLHEEFKALFDLTKAGKYISDKEVFDLIKEKYKGKDIGDIKELSDLFSGITKNKFNLGFGHRKEYWEVTPVSIEAFAEFTSSTVVNPGSLKLIKEVFPKSYEIYLEILDYAIE